MSAKPLDQWSDEEIRDALHAHKLMSNVPVTSTTRPFFIRKLEGLINTPSPLTGPDHGCISQNESPIHIQTPTENSLGDKSIEGYYGVTVLPSSSSTSEAVDHVSTLSPFYTSRSDTLKAIKKLSGARFKRFNSQAMAEAFSSQTQHEITEETDSPSFNSISFDSSANSKRVTREKANSFQSVKTQDLTKFRIMIEKGDVDSFLDCVASNPRYLITAGDAPEILKPPTRYNALHCAVKSGQLEICRQLLCILQSDEFWSMVYPDDDVEKVRPIRKQHLLDLYLNMQDKGFNETPLHFACKLGHVEIVAFLMTFSLTSTKVKNKEGNSPFGVICQNVSNPNSECKYKIEELLKEPGVYYIPVFRREDNSTPPRLGLPCTLDILEEVESQVDGCKLPEVSNGLAGPLSPCEAKQFYREWKTPSGSSERKETARIKRSDSDRGLERIGRQLAHRKDVGWVEYWDFLGCCCDLSKPDGQQLLEEFLQSKSGEHQDDDHIEEDCVDYENPVQIKPKKGALTYKSSLYNQNHISDESDLSRKLFADDDVEEAGIMEVKVEREMKHEQSDTSEKLSEMLAAKLSLATDDEDLFISGTLPTKVDNDVLLALCGTHPDPSEYPYINKWLGLLQRYSKEEQRSWRTPRKQQKTFKRSSLDHTPSSLPVSPLVYSSPSMQSHGNSSPLVASGSSLTQSTQGTDNVNTTPKQHPFHYWPRQSTTPKGRRVVRSTNTTPRRHGQPRILTPTSYGRLSFTPKV